MNASLRIFLLFILVVAIFVLSCAMPVYSRLFEDRQWRQNVSLVDVSQLPMPGVPGIDPDAPKDTTLTPFLHPKTWSCQTGVEVSSVLATRDRKFDVVLHVPTNSQLLTLLSSVYINAVQWSPNCDVVAVEVRSGSQEGIHIFSAQGVLLNSEVLPGRTPTWSPDSQRLAYIAGKRGTNHLFVARADGSDIQQLTFSHGYDTEPTWAPDGSWIAFAYEPWDAGIDYFSPSTAIHIIRPDGTERRAITPPDLYLARYPLWSVDSQFVAYNCGRESGGQRQSIGICVVDIEQARTAWVQKGSGKLQWQQ